MSESVRDLVVTLSLDPSDYNRNLKAVAASIKEAEAQFKLAGAGVKNFENSLSGLQAKGQMLSSTLTAQGAAIQQLEGKLQAAKDAVAANQQYLETYRARLQSARQAEQALTQQLQQSASRRQQANQTINATRNAMANNLSALEANKAELASVDSQLAGLESTYAAMSAAYGTNSSAVQSLAQQIQALKQRQHELQTQGRSLQNNHRALANTLKQSQQAVLAEDKAEAQLAAQKAALGDEIKKLEGQVKAETRQLITNRTKVSELNAKLTEARAKYKEIQAAIAANNRALLEQQNGWIQASKALDKFSQKATAFGKGATQIGRTLTRSVTTPIVTLGTTAIKAAMDYESAFAYVRKTVHATESEYENLSAGIIDMSTKYARSATDIAQVVATAGQLGIANEHLLTFSKAMIDISNTAADIDAETAATQLAKFANIMGSSQGDFDRMGSTLIELGNNFATTEAPIMEMSMRLAGAGKQIGLTEAQVMGIATALSSLGIEAQMGGSSMSKALIKMEVAAATGGKELTDFASICGMTADTFKTAWAKDPVKVFQSFIEGLARMDDEGVSAIAVLNDIGISEIRLRDTLLRTTNATELFARAQNMANSAWSRNTTLQTEADKRYGTTASKLTNLKNKAMEAARTIGNDMTPTVQEWIEKAGELVNKFMGMDEAQRGTIEKWAAIAAAAGPAMLVLGRAATGIGNVTKVMSNGMKAIGNFTVSVAQAGGGVKGFLSAVGGLSTGAKVGLGLGITAAVIAGAVALYDYASGAKAARDAIEGMNEVAQDFKRNSADSFYKNDGMGALGLDKSIFTRQAVTADQYFSNLVNNWNTVKKKSKETVTYWQDGWKSLTAETRAGLQDILTAAQGKSGYGPLTASIETDMQALDKIDKKYTSILNRARNRALTANETKQLQQLMDQRQAIQIRYNLVENKGGGTGGFDEIDAQVKAVEKRVSLLGKNGVDVEVYQNAAVAYAQGWADVREQLENDFDTNIKLNETAISHAQNRVNAAQAAIDAQTQAGKRVTKKQQKELEAAQAELAAAQAMTDQIIEGYKNDYNAAEQRYKQGIAENLGKIVAGDDFKGTVDQLGELYSLIQQFGMGNEGGLQNLEAFVKGMDEGKWTDLATTLTLIAGLDSEKRDAIIGDNDSLRDALGMYMAIAQVAAQFPEQLSALSTIFGDALPEEVSSILQGFSLKDYANVWDEFAKDQTVDIEGAVLKISEVEFAPDALSSVDKELTRDIKIEKFVLDLTDGKGLTESEKTIDGFTAIVNKYIEDSGVDKTQLTASGVTLLVSKIAAATGATFDQGQLEAVVNAVLGELGIPGPSQLPRVTLWGDLVLSPMSKRAVLDSAKSGGWTAQSFKSASLASDAEKDLIISIGYDYDQLTDRDLIVYDEDGKLHVVVVPEIEGTTESVRAASEAMASGILGTGIASTRDKLFAKLSDLRGMNKKDMDFATKFVLGGMFGDFGVDEAQMLEIDSFVAEAVKHALSGGALEQAPALDLSRIAEYALKLGELGEGGQFRLDLLNSMISGGLEGVNTANFDSYLSAIMSYANQFLKEGTDAKIDFDILDLFLPKASAAEAENAVEKSLGPVLKVEPETEVDEAPIESAIESAVGSAASAASGRASSGGRGVGMNLAAGIVSGLNSYNFSGAASGLAAKLLAAVKGSLEIASPSHLFEREVGKFVAAGIGQGFLKEIPNQGRLIANASRELSSFAHSGLGFGSSVNNTSNQTFNSNSNLHVDTMIMQGDMDAEALMAQMTYYNKREAKGYGS